MPLGKIEKKIDFLPAGMLGERPENGPRVDRTVGRLFFVFARRTGGPLFAPAGLRPVSAGAAIALAKNLKKSRFC